MNLLSMKVDGRSCSKTWVIFLIVVVGGEPSVRATLKDVAVMVEILYPGGCPLSGRICTCIQAVWLRKDSSQPIVETGDRDGERWKLGFRFIFRSWSVNGDIAKAKEVGVPEFGWRIMISLVLRKWNPKSRRILWVLRCLMPRSIDEATWEAEMRGKLRTLECFLPWIELKLRMNIPSGWTIKQGMHTLDECFALGMWFRDADSIVSDRPLNWWSLLSDCLRSLDLVCKHLSVSSNDEYLSFRFR